jgi:ABC-type transporter Mla subunit MlaD
MQNSDGSVPSLPSTPELSSMMDDCAQEHLDIKQKQLSRLEKELYDLKQEAQADVNDTLQNLLQLKETLQQQLTTMEKSIAGKLEKVEFVTKSSLFF